MTNDIIKDTRDHMDKTHQALLHEFAGVRTGRASAAILDKIHVDAYGSSMPLNQVANDQKGSANLGSAIANFGMEDWATYYSHVSYSPFWAGSHFFHVFTCVRHATAVPQKYDGALAAGILQHSTPLLAILHMPTSQRAESMHCADSKGTPATATPDCNMRHAERHQLLFALDHVNKAHRHCYNYSGPHAFLHNEPI